MNGLRNRNYEMILEIIQNCEEIQESNESRYTKECAKISAYEEIKELIRERKENE